MRYALNGDGLVITAEPEDQWTGTTSSDGTVTDGGITCGLVDCKDGRRRTLKITLNGKPGLAALVAKLDDIREHTVTIDLASRGWGDYSPVSWRGDIRRETSDIAAECQAELARATDVDAVPSDAEIAGLIDAARIKHAAPILECEPVKHGVGWCDKCSSYCFGDCDAGKM